MIASSRLKKKKRIIKCYDLILSKGFVLSLTEFLKGKKASAIMLSFVHLCSPLNNSGIFWPVSVRFEDGFIPLL